MFAFDTADSHDEPTPRQTNRQPVAGIDAVDLVDDMLVAMTRLSDLLEIENQALAQHRHDLTERLQDEKAGLCRLYVQRLKALAEDTKRLEAARAERGEEMREAGERLKRLSERNATLLKSALAATQRFLDAVVSSARETDDKPRYARNGKVSSPRRAASLTYNQTL